MFTQAAPLAERAANLFYARLFQLDPSLRPMFKSGMADQGRKLMTMLNVVVNGLTRLETLVPAVQELERRRAGYGVTHGHCWIKVIADAASKAIQEMSYAYGTDVR